VTPLLRHLAAGGAAFAAGLVNAVAGGGTLISFPTLVALGVPPVSANITNTVALCPGYFGGTVAQRHDLAEEKRRLVPLGLAAALGGLAGSVLLVITSEALFREVVPYLILLACALLGLQDQIRKRLGLGEGGEGGERHLGLPWIVVMVLLAAIYGGYFGAGLGIMLLAALGIASSTSINKQNAVKQALSLIINVVAAIFFAFSGQVAWWLAGVMTVGSLVGGSLGGRIASRLHPRILRAAVVLLGVAVAVRFFLK